MQILEHIKKKPLSAQNLIEFVFVMPVLIFLTLVIFEVALFWQDVNAIYNLNAEINANVALSDLKGMNIDDRCLAATRAIDILKKRDSMITLSESSYNDLANINDPNLIVDGKEPFALYKYYANPITVGGKTKPQIALWVDCRNPFEDGVMTQLEFFHKTMIIKASIPRFDKAENPEEQVIEILPENIFIASPKLNTLRHY